MGDNSRRLGQGVVTFTSELALRLHRERLLKELRAATAEVAVRLNRAGAGAGAARAGVGAGQGQRRQRCLPQQPQGPSCLTGTT